jgi:pimeloyl-ACP methyl ester carboxylesterase
MDATTEAPRSRMIDLPERGGAMAAIEMGPADRPVDVVFSHANGFNGRTYRSILAPLADDLRILAIDLRGHGASTLPAEIEGRPGWITFRDDLLALLDVACEAPVVLAGHSMGGAASLLAAAAAPEPVRAVALFDPVVMPLEAQANAEAMANSPLALGAARRRATFPSKEAAFEAYRGRGGFKTWSDVQLRDYVEAGFRETPEGEVTLTCAPEWEASNFRLHNIDAFAAFRQVRCPVSVLRAEVGSTCRIEGHEAEITASGRVTLETVPGTSHFLPMERPELVVQTLRRALAA